MKKLLNDAGPATVLVAVTVLIVVLIGGAVVIIDAATGVHDFTFADYLDALSKAAVGGGLLGIGRGILTGARAHATSGELAFTTSAPGAFAAARIRQVTHIDPEVGGVADDELPADDEEFSDGTGGHSRLTPDNPDIA